MFALVQASVTNQEQWEEMLATKGLTGKKSREVEGFLCIVCKVLFALQH